MTSTSTPASDAAGSATTPFDPYILPSGQANHEVRPPTYALSGESDPALGAAASFTAPPPAPQPSDTSGRVGGSATATRPPNITERADKACLGDDRSMYSVSSSAATTVAGAQTPTRRSYHYLIVLTQALLCVCGGGGGISGVGLLGILILWWKWRGNYMWITQKLFMFNFDLNFRRPHQQRQVGHAVVHDNGGCDRGHCGQWDRSMIYTFLIGSLSQEHEAVVGKHGIGKAGRGRVKYYQTLQPPTTALHRDQRSSSGSFLLPPPHALPPASVRPLLVFNCWLLGGRALKAYLTLSSFVFPPFNGGPYRPGQHDASFFLHSPPPEPSPASRVEGRVGEEGAWIKVEQAGLASSAPEGQCC
ncbi:hypothetical protein FA13DRAFT_1711321 [Coprinellus micaceus]|uniref:Uncharacterized protein n=1 Tax=Coprinellus micaceus TaxID=71717 RepID=A0A4Y7T5Q4_COPMI|nr:hypothetical protein FA13DRAFT_1711321 [Coprinellus micaceus]